MTVNTSGFRKATNDQLDQAFEKINLQYFAAANPLVRGLLFMNLQIITEEITRRDSSVKDRLKKYLSSIKGKTTNDDQRQQSGSRTNSGSGSSDASGY